MSERFRCSLCGMLTPAECERPLHHVGCGVGAPTKSPLAVRGEGSTHDLPSRTAEADAAIGHVDTSAPRLPRSVAENGAVTSQLRPSHRNTPEHNAWNAMKARCLNPEHHAYANYGGRGITVCDAWRESFVCFLQDMGPRPSAEHSLDRIDNDGSYGPGNCRWATRGQQNANTRDRGESPYLGVSRASRQRGWQATLKVNQRTQHLGCFATEEEAARARDVAVIEQGLGLVLNFPLDGASIEEEDS